MRYEESDKYSDFLDIEDNISRMKTDYISFYPDYRYRSVL